MKQTFNIPEGCKVVTVEQIGNQLITSFEPEKYVPKVGDCVKMTYSSGNIYFYEVSEVKGYQIGNKNVIITPEGVVFESFDDFVTYSSIEKLTPEEFQAEFEKLGYVYDFETHTAIKKRKRVAFGEFYYCADSIFKPHAWTEAGVDFDTTLFEAGNYFETKEECQKYCDYMKECSLKYFDK